MNVYFIEGWAGPALWPALLNFKTIFLSILLEAVPFLLLSVLVSALFSQFLTEDLLTKILPKGATASAFLACFLGLLFPACDCGTVPIARRLVEKGVPLRTAITFFLTAPIVNPVVIVATSYAFGWWAFAFARVFFALVIAAGTGWFIDRFFIGTQLRETFAAASCDCSCSCPTASLKDISWLKRLQVLGEGVCSEFFEMGKYLLLGACVGALVQTFLPRSLLLDLGHDPLLSVVVMMLFAFGISVCSSADAFIASSFINSFTSGSLMAFIVFGPMIDLKNLLMLLHAFKPRFVLALTAAVALICCFCAYCMNVL